MTDKLREYAEKYKQKPYYKNGQPLSVCPQIYLKRGFLDGFRLGAEFAEWANLNDWYAIKDGGQVLWMNDKSKQVLPTPELTELFLNDKMKEK